MGRSIDHICAAVYNFAVLAGCAYLVGWKDWSAWWFLLAFICLTSSSKDRE